MQALFKARWPGRSGFILNVLGWLGLGCVVWLFGVVLWVWVLSGAGAAVCFQGWVAGTFEFDSVWWAGLG